MYLKKIKAQGFKSFADKIEIDLDNKITGIVGPNGSGKSNVVDAVRWVLGEQSVKSLRGENGMSDVIFTGSKSRNPLNIATVSLVFDNTDNYLKIPTEEVSIKRMVYKDGTNEYYINEEKVRLKDIQDLLMDRGIGKDSFNIISQGKIDEILLSKPSDRRLIFEEAAGVLKYKKRKDEAIKRLEKTNNNLSRINDIIKELENQIEPLKEQKKKAEKYIESKNELESIEVTLITNDITNMNYIYQDKLGKIDKIKEDILSLTTTNSNNEAIIEQYKLKITKIEEEYRLIQNELLEITKKVEQINSKKDIILERKKYEVDNTKLHDNIVSLNENKLKLDNIINKLSLEKEQYLTDYKEIIGKLSSLDSQNNNRKLEKTNLENKLNNLIKEQYHLESIISSINDYINSNGNLPIQVKKILSNPKLRGIHNILGNIIETTNEYVDAIQITLGSQSNYIIVDNESSAKEAINYLNNNNLGRCTFLPINVIKSKYLDNLIIDKIKNEKGYIDLASNLVKYDSKYSNIVLSYLNSTIIVDNIDSANRLSKIINYSYRIVTLNGEVINKYGSITGGTNKSKSLIKEKYELELKEKDLINVKTRIKEIELNLNNISDELIKLDDKIYLLNKDKINKETYINSINNNIEDYNIKLQKVIEEINGTNNVLNNSLDKEEEIVLNEYYEALKQKEEIVYKEKGIKKNKDNLNDVLQNFELTLRKDNSEYNSKNELLKTLEIEVNRLDVKLDSLLNDLSENYNMTYENASSLYKLEMEENIARNKVNSLKRIIKELGNVNLDATSEYEKVSTRYEFLIKQRDDLVNAENTLNDIIEEMDKIMIKEFTKTFKVIKENFKETFKELFKGGEADLILTDNDILTTGIEIMACPPGKSLKTINALSGGEKTFTAISLLFAILKSRPMPFCILDEVEAALDEANVDAFGDYITKLKGKTQFILITHKKRTMEYIDSLYGITMQESGVSKLVSVRLEEYNG